MRITTDYQNLNQSDYQSLNHTPENHSHQVTEHIFEHQVKRSVQGGMSALDNKNTPGVIYEPSSSTQKQKEPEGSLLSQAVRSGKDFLKKIWGPTKEELALSQERTVEAGAEKLNPYPSRKRKNPLAPFVREFKKRVIHVTTGFFHFQSGSSGLPKENKKKKPPEHVIVENVKLELHTDPTYSEHLLDSYDRTGAYVPLASQAPKKSSQEE